MRTLHDAGREAILIPEANSGEGAQEEERVQPFWWTGRTHQPGEAMQPVVARDVMAQQPVCVARAAERDAA